ncbi:MAG TPA: hypothetical protein VFR24_07335 [Candidatus Angelobacter sp.]|nr:hypothetical protein [Candidatus Angelobacter sp.]
MRRLLTFIGFLLFYVLWMWLSQKTLKRNQRKIRSSKSFLSNQLMFLNGYWFFFVGLYLLAGLWNTKLVLLFLAAGEIGIFLSWAISEVFKKREEQSSPHLLWVTSERLLGHPGITLTFMIIAVLTMVVFPIVIGFVYFRYAGAGRPLTIHVIRYLIVMLYCFFPMTLLLEMNLLGSENLDNDSRRKLFVADLTGLLPKYLFLALGLWAFGVGGQEQTFGIGPLTTFSPRMLIILGSFFVLTTLLPYLLGTHRNKEWQLDLLQKRKGYLAEMSNLLRRPRHTEYIPRLTDLKDKIERTRSAFIDADQTLKQMQEIEKAPPDEVPAEFQDLIWAMNQSRDVDPRLKFNDALFQLQNEINEIISDLQARTEADSIDKAGKWAATYDKLREELTYEHETAKKSKPAIVALAGTAAMGIMSSLLSQFGKQAWEILSHAAK